MRFSKVFAFIFILLLPHSLASADWVWSPEQGKFINTQAETQNDANDLFDNALDLFKEKKLDKAVEQFELLLKKYPRSRVAPEAQYRLGTIFEEKGDLVKAHKAYQALIKSYPQSERFEEVIEREYQIGMQFMSGKKGKIMGLNIRPSLPLAAEIFKKIVEVAPYGAFGDKAQLNVGIAYQKDGKYDDAIEAYQNLIDQYPQSPFVKDARLQMAEASYAKSSVQTRDQSALDTAAAQAQGYLQRYPGSQEAERAAKIRQQVDELNAEKNYRIGVYYENDNFLESALIYYRDTAKRYPNTSWGKKAADKLKFLQEPVKYLNAETHDLQKELQGFEAKYRALGSGKNQKAECAKLKKEIDQLKKRISQINKNKAEGLNRRKQDIKRREEELKEKFKELARKKKRYKNNTSAEFQKAIARWQASLEAERDALAEEKVQLASWRSESGVPESKFYENLIPFRGPSETPLQKIQKIDEKELYKLSCRKKGLLEKKEKLYKRYSELQKELTPERSESGLVRKRLRGIKKQDVSKPADPILASREKEIEELEEKLDVKTALYEKYFGKVAKLELEAQLNRKIAKNQASNPFGAETGDLKGKSLEELLVLKMNLQEQITTERNIVETLSTAFDRELALREQQSMMNTLVEKKAGDKEKMRLRKQTKALEKEIRARYQDIQDRDKHKNQLLAELDRTLYPQKRRGSFLRTLAAPVTGTVYLAKAFLFGLPNQDVVLTKAAAQRPDSDAQVKKLKDAIELESLMIQAQDQELLKLRKEHEILDAKASLGGGAKFRSSLVSVPYAFIDEAVQSARRIIPRKDRKEVLLARLDKQTKDLEILTNKLKATEALIAEKTKSAATAPTSTSTASAATPEAGDKEESKPDEKTLRDEAMFLQEQLEVSYGKYAQEQGIVLGYVKKEDLSQGNENSTKYHELIEVKAELVKAIDEELGIEAQEKMILEKRIREADKALPGVTSKAMKQDLSTEKDRMQQRIADLVTRQSFLSKEKERFNSQ